MINVQRQLVRANTGSFTSSLYATGVELSDQGLYALSPTRMRMSREIRPSFKDPLVLEQRSVGNRTWIQLREYDGSDFPAGDCWLVHDPAWMSEQLDVTLPTWGYGVPTPVWLLSYAVGREFVGKGSRTILGTTNLYTALGTVGNLAALRSSLSAESTDRVTMTIDLEPDAVTMEIAWRDLVAAVVASEAKVPKGFRNSGDDDAVLIFEVEFEDLDPAEIAEVPAQRDVVTFEDLAAADQLPHRCGGPPSGIPA